MKVFNIFLFLFLFFSISIFAQFGSLQGKVVDAETGEGIPFVNVAFLVDGKTTGG